jgi:CrcB protein
VKDRPGQRRATAAQAGLVALGGAFGAAARYGVEVALEGIGPWPWGTLVVNLAGSLALGWLLGYLGSMPDAARWRVLRLTLGPGFLGGFTTYSALAVEASTAVVYGLTGSGEPVAWVGLQLVYLVLSVAAGVVLACLGLLVGGRAGRARPARAEGRAGA